MSIEKKNNIPEGQPLDEKVLNDIRKDAYEHAKKVYEKNHQEQNIKDNADAPKPRNPYDYHEFFSFTLDKKHLLSSDSVQFRRANKALIERLKNDAEFRKDMYKRHPELQTWVNNKGALSRSPSGFTWYHSNTMGY